MIEITGSQVVCGECRQTIGTVATNGQVQVLVNRLNFQNCKAAGHEPGLQCPNVQETLKLDPR